MNTDKNLVMGVFENQNELEYALETLRGQGFRSENVSALVSHVRSAHLHFAGEPLGWLAEAGDFETITRYEALMAGGPVLIALRDSQEHLADALITFGVPKFDAEFYELCVKAGKAFLSVHVDSGECLEKARETLKIAAAQSISVTRNVSEEVMERPVVPADAPPYIGEVPGIFLSGEELMDRLHQIVDGYRLSQKTIDVEFTSL